MSKIKNMKKNIEDLRKVNKFLTFFGITSTITSFLALYEAQQGSKIYLPNGKKVDKFVLPKKVPGLNLDIDYVNADDVEPKYNK